MSEFLRHPALIPLFPFIGWLLLRLAPSLKRAHVNFIGVGSVTASFLASIAAFVRVDERVVTELWRWLDVGGWEATVALALDPLSIVMCLVITGVGALIHLYSTHYMAEEEGYQRFFAHLNLFVGSMLVLVMAADLLLLYLGWELVGLCSYLLIGFWYDDPENGRAARKAFVVTRVGDVALALGLFALLAEFGTLAIDPVLAGATAEWATGSTIATMVAAALLIGAIGKSAQLPLQVWLPDAMAGPTPVSALIHAATMVTAGVYLIARTYPLFELAPVVLEAVAVIGTVTMLVAGLAALAQRDIKRVLAYSTVSQLGYMFLALGVGAPLAAIFHLVTHAFFKAQLFLGAGAVIHATGGEHDITEMGGLRIKLPLTFWTFTLSAASLAGLPFVTAGFYSKEAILSSAWTASGGSAWFWAAGLVGAFITALYAFRLVFEVFYGEVSPTETTRQPIGWPMKFAMVTLTFLALAGGLLWLPESMGDLAPLRDYLVGTLPAAATRSVGVSHLTIELLGAVAAIAGIAAAWALFVRRKDLVRWTTRAGLGAMVKRAAREGWYVDRAYQLLIVTPFVKLGELNRDDVLDRLVDAVEWGMPRAHSAARRTQTGSIRLYVAMAFVGLLFLLALGVLR